MARMTAQQRHVLVMGVRTSVALVLVIVAYYRAPLDDTLTLSTGLLFVAVLLALALALVVQVRGILASSTPLLRAVRTLVIGLPVLLVVFAATDGLYFTVTTFATVGYGDISPVTELARIVVTIQMVVGIITVGLIAKVVLGAAQVARQRNTAARSSVEP